MKQGDNATARHAEIRRRYARHRRDKFGPYDRGKHRCAELLRLAEHRRRHGRLDFDPHEVVVDVRADPRTWTARAIGTRIKLTWQERIELGIKTIRPYDLTNPEFKKRKLERRRILSRKRSRLYRLRKKHPPDRARESDAAVQPSGTTENPCATTVSYTFVPLHSSVTRPVTHCSIPLRDASTVTLLCSNDNWPNGSGTLHASS